LQQEVKLKPHLLFPILQDLQLGFARQQVKNFAAVDLEIAAKYYQVLVGMLGRVEELENISRGKRIDAITAVLVLPLELASHGVRLARTSLPICKAGGHAPLKDAVHEIPCCVLVDYLVA